MKLSNFSFERIYDTAFLKSSTFCFHLFLFEYVVSLVSLEKAFILCNYFYNDCIVFNSCICR